MQAGIDTATGRLIATMDGDLQNDPKDIPSMVEELERRQLDLLVGWRRNRQDGLFLRKIPPGAQTISSAASPASSCTTMAAA